MQVVSFRGRASYKFSWCINVIKLGFAKKVTSYTVVKTNVAVI